MRALEADGTGNGTWEGGNNQRCWTVRPPGVPTSILLLVLYILACQTLVYQKTVLFPCLYNLHTSW